MNSNPDESLSFEQALAQLEEAVHALEEGKLGLEESLGCYEQGIGYLRRCHAQLQQAEQKILQLTGVDEQGQPKLVPFEHKAAAEVERKRRPANSQDANP